MTLAEIKLAAYNWTEPPNMDVEERFLWEGLGYCYEWYRSHPEDKDECDKLAQNYIKHYYLRKMVGEQNDSR